MFLYIIVFLSVSVIPAYCTTETEELNYFYSVEKGLIDSIKHMLTREACAEYKVIMHMETIDSARHGGLLANYDPAIRPWVKTNKTHKFPVYIGATVHAILEIEEKEETMTTSLAVAMFWWDKRITWHPAQYENITYIYMQAQNVWRPIWFITNSNDKESIIEFEDWVPVRYEYTGQAMWQQMGTIKTSCEIDITYFPFDTQVCSIKLHWYEYEIISGIQDTDHFEYYVDNGLWDVIDHEIKSNDDSIPSYEIVYTFKRKPDYTIYNILFPVLLIALLGPLVFLLPVESGERVSYSITVLLTVSVYMTIINENLPHSSKPMAFLTYELFSLYVFCALIVMVVIFTTKIHHYSPQTPVPNYLKVLFHVFGCTKKFKHGFSVVKKHVRKRIHRGKMSQKHENGSCVEADRGFENTKQTEEERLNPGDENESCSDETSWQDVAMALDRIALYTFYFLKLLFLVIFLCVAFGNKDK